MSHRPPKKLKINLGLILSPRIRKADEMPRNNTNSLEYIRASVPKDAARTAFHKGLADATQIKYEMSIAMAHYIEEQDEAAKAARIIKLGKRIDDLGRSIVETEAEFATFTGDKMTQLETLGYSLEVYLEETKAMLRNTERELSQLLGNPPSAEELEEKELQKTFVSLSFKAGMAAYVREDIIESAPYHTDLKNYWNQHIEECQDAIEGKTLAHE